VTDADLVLGYLNPDWFLGGAMKLDREAALTAIRTHIAEPLGLSELEAAAGVREIADQQMADLLRQSTLERGYDPRDFCLFAYGGAGPLHASAFGREAGVRSIVIPRSAPVFSAHGILAADMRLSRQRSILQRSNGNPKARAEGLDAAAIEAVFAELEKEVREAFRRYGVGKSGAAGSSEQARLVRSVSMRYARQVHEVSIPVEGAVAADRLIAEFDRVYEHRYGKGTGSRNAVVEVTNCHLQLVQPLPKVDEVVADLKGDVKPEGTRRVYVKGWIDAPVFRWDRLPLGATFQGPALVDATGTTVWIGAGDTATVDSLGNLRISGAAA
jgi:N-methylhydantoinase A